MSVSFFKKRSEWSDRDTEVLLEVWENNFFDLRRTKRNTCVFEKMRKELEELDVERSVQEIRSKVKNLQAKHRGEKKRIDPTGEPPTWRFYDRVDRIIKSFHFKEESSPVPGASAETFDADDHDDIIVFGDSCASPVSCSSPVSVRKFSPGSRSAKRKLSDIHEEILGEIKRANIKAEEQLDIANKILEKANEFAERSLQLQEKLINTLCKM